MAATNPNVFEQNTKKLLLKRIRSDSNDVIELGSINRVRQWDKEFDGDFQRRREGGDRRIVDLENVEEVWQVDALINNDLIALSDETSGTVDLEVGGSVDIESIEDVEIVLNDMMRSFNPDASIIAPYELVYGGRSHNGFIGSLSIDESAGDDNSVFLVQFDFIIAKYA